MRLVRYERAGEACLAIVDGETPIDVRDALAARSGASTEQNSWFSDMIAFIVADSDARAVLQEVVRSDAPRVSLDGARLLGPLDPGIILCSGENY